MLELKNIKKMYNTGDEKLEALKGINLKFREAEFVSILGQSGCGKTTLLNIIGGLDRYSSGDLIINGKSTKDFKDRDWDAYRNYSVGFIFQSYNLIGHQTVLSNVELALTISGITKKDRRKRAIKALEEVGLKEHIYKKPNQLSGGQMQRVAIARALVNDPDIILADEPTGALDTKTSVQVMEILKNISKNKLIIMVTHNPELAQNYSSRIIKILDGKIIEDSNPVKSEEIITFKEKKYSRTSMKFLTALRLSLNNLMTKKARTILTSFAGSIGIIGIALILAISTGIQNYIDKVEEDTLSSYPLSIENESIDMSSMMQVMMGSSEDENTEVEDGKIYSEDIMNDMLSVLSNKIQTNNLKELKQYIESTENDIKTYSNAIEYSYGLNLNVYKENTEDGIVKVNPSTVLESMGMMSSSSNNGSISMQSSFVATDVWTELLDNEELNKSQYDLLAGSWPKAYNEVVVIVGKNNEVSDYTLYSLGIKNQDELKDKMKAIQNGEKIEESTKTSYTYDDFLNLSYKLLLNSDYYQKEKNIWLDKSNDEEYLKNKIKEAQTIKVVGIIKQNDQSLASNESGLIGYTKELKEYVINKSNEAQIVVEQKENEKINIFTGMNFVDDNGNAFNYNSLPEEQKLAMSKLSNEEIVALMNAYSDNEKATYEGNLKLLGAYDLSEPTKINIYPKDFDSKDKIISAIEKYNQIQKDNGKEENNITYTDLVGSMMNSVSTIINVISYVLISFVAVSLIVSSIMIGIITYISVLERTKEIGILRAIGASKKDISRVFNAETMIVGLISGLIGIGVTIILTFPINAIIYMVTGVVIKTTVPFIAAIVLIILSVILTLIGGLIPAKLASKKDPVIALRTE